MEAQHGKPQAKEEWSTGFFDCFSDFRNCCLACWCPCITFGQIANIVDKGATSCGAAGAIYTLIAVVVGFGGVYSFCYRQEMRAQFNLKGNDCGDCLMHVFCEPCALAQEYRELQNRGFDMSLGYEGSMEKKQNQGVAMGAPVSEGGMTR